MTAREIGGAELYVEQLVNALATECHFTIAMADHSALAPLRERLSVSAHVIPLPFDNPRAWFSMTRRLRALANTQDVVHLNSSHPASRLGIFFAFVLNGIRVPRIAVEHRATPVTDVQVPKIFVPFLPTLFRMSRRGMVRVVAVSADNAQVLVEGYHLPKAQVQVIHNGIRPALYQLTPDVQEKARDALRAELHLMPTQPIVLTLARLTANKGHRFLVQAAPEILTMFPEAHFVFAGAPDERAALETQINQLNLLDKFSFLGFRADTVSLLNASDIFVLPSLAEGFALSLIEALASGLPVVATRVGGAPEVIRDGENGFLVPPADAPALAQAVIRALSLDESARARLQQAALETARNFSIETMARKMLALYRDVIDKR